MDLNKKGCELLSQMQFQEALGCFEQVLREEPKHSKASYNKVTALMGLNQLQKAEEWCEHALALLPKDADLWERYGMVLGMQQKFGEAIQCFDKALELEPEKAEFWAGKGLMLAQTQQLKEALDCYNHTIELDPENSEYWDGRGMVFMFQEKYADALESYDKAIALDTTRLSPRMQKCTVLMAEKQYQQAISCAEKMIQMFPSEGTPTERFMRDHRIAHIWSVKGYAHVELGQYQDALQCFTSCLNLDPGFGDVWLLKGVLHEILGEIPDVQDCYKKYRTPPEHPYPRLSQDWSMLPVADAEAELDDSEYVKTFKLRARENSILRNIDKTIESGLKLLRAGQSDEAENVLNEAVIITRYIKTTFQDPTFYLNIFKDMIACLKECNALDPRFTLALLITAYISFALDLDEPILEYSSQVLEVQPSNADAWYIQAIGLSLSAVQEGRNFTYEECIKIDDTLQKVIELAQDDDLREQAIQLQKIHRNE